MPKTFWICRPRAAIGMTRVASNALAKRGRIAGHAL